MKDYFIAVLEYKIFDRIYFASGLLKKPYYFVSMLLGRVNTK